MAQQKKGFIARMLEGKERSEEYARSTLPTNRWQLFWDIFKGNFGKIVKVNLLTLLFCIPMLAILIVSFIAKTNQGMLYPFGANIGLGYPMAPQQQGMSEMLNLYSNLLLYVGLVLTSFITAVGLAGGMYVVRNMVWTEGIFVANDFWRGIKLNYKNALQTTLFFTVIYAMCSALIDLAEFNIALGEMSKFELVWMRISQVFSNVFIFVSAMMTFWMVALGVNYTLKFPVLLKNAFLLSVGTFPQTIFFGACALVPYLLFLIGNSFFTIVAIILCLLCGVAYTLLVWLDFAQWVFDKYINPKIGAKVGRGIYSKDGSAPAPATDSHASIEYQRTILAYGKSKLVAKPIKPIDDSVQVYELPSSFTRDDLKKLRESKQTLAEDSEAYAEEHKNDFRYVEYNKQFEERERALQDSDLKKKKKKKPPKMLDGLK